MIKFNKYKSKSLKILIPPYRPEDFDNVLTGGEHVLIYGGYRIYKNLLDNKVYFSIDKNRIIPAILKISDKKDWPVKKDKAHYRIWFPTKKDHERFKEDMSSKILSENFIFDPKNRDSFERVKSKWSYYVVKYD